VEKSSKSFATEICIYSIISIILVTGLILIDLKHLAVINKHNNQYDQTTCFLTKTKETYYDCNQQESCQNISSESC
jgi:hypothetical protein